MFKTLQEFTNRPKPFAISTVSELWTRPHLAKQMLQYHLDQHTEAASRTHESILKTVNWLDEQISLNGKTLCDLGCGPGLYATEFAEHGATVTGIDFSQHSLDYAEKMAAESGHAITYKKADYVADELPSDFDIVTLIYYDFCVLSEPNRKTLLAKIVDMLKPGGVFALDVFGTGSFAAKQESLTIEPNLMGGFWSAGDYIGLHRTLLYAEEMISLDPYLIVEPENQWQIYNWHQHFTQQRLINELEEAGLIIEQLTASLTGEPLSANSPNLAALAKKPK